MNKTMKYIICTVMLAAIVLMTVSSLYYISLGSELHTSEQNLSVSRNHWEKIAEEKEALQADLKIKQDSLKEAKLSLEEATERAVELRAEIEQLKTDIESMKLSLSDAH